MLTRRAQSPFEVRLDVFTGPFEVLLGLIAKHRLDVTEIALAQVTDDFVAYLHRARTGGEPWDLSQASEFVLVAATLLDLKASRLLPHAREDEEDLTLIEARDLLFARLLQYRAYKEVAAAFDQRLTAGGRVWPRDVGVEDRFTRLLPELVMVITPEQLAVLAAGALVPAPLPQVGVSHLLVTQVSVREQADLIVARLRSTGACTFAELVADARSTAVVVARFLAVLDLFGEATIEVSQEDPLGDVSVRWSGGCHPGRVAAVAADPPPERAR